MVINYSGRASELAGISSSLLTDDGPVSHALIDHLSQATLITHFDD